MKLERFSMIIGISLILLLNGCSREEEMPATAASGAAKELATATTVLATISDDEMPQADSAAHGDQSPLQDKPITFQAIFSDSGKGAAYTVGKSATIYVVHKGIKSKEYASVGKVLLSPDGQHIAYGVYVDEKWRMIINGKAGSVLSTSISSPVLSPDGQHVAYQAMIDGKWHLVVDNRANSGTKTNYTVHEFNADSSLIAYVEDLGDNKTARLFVSDLKFSKQHIKDAMGKLLVVNRDKTRLAATKVVDNKLRIIDFSFAKPDVVHEGRLYDAIDHLTFGEDGVSLAYVAVKGGARLMVLDDREEPLPDGDLRELPVIRPDKKGVGVLLSSQNGSFLHQSFLNSREKRKLHDEAAFLAYSKDGHYAYAARTGKKKFFVVVNGKEGPLFDMVVAPKFSPDGKRLVYRARKNGKRFLVEADTTGKTIKLHPTYEQVFQPVFTADGKSVAYGVKDGNKLVWKVEKLGQ